jgi:hypothetical protein
VYFFVFGNAIQSLDFIAEKDGSYLEKNCHHIVMAKLVRSWTPQFAKEKRLIFYAMA